MKQRIELTPRQTLDFFKLNEETRIGMIIKTKAELSNKTSYSFKGVVESYTVDYGIATLICEGEEVFRVQEEVKK